MAGPILVYIGGCLRVSSVSATCNPADIEKALEGLADSRVIVNDKHNRLGDGWVLQE
jgi:hypothetical protein